MMDALLRNWSFTRVLRLVMAGVFLVAALSSGEWIAGAFGGVLALQAILNVGCCGTACAAPPVSRSRDGVVGEVEYEEVR